MIAAILWDVDPRLFSGLEFFRWYGVCWALGVLVGYGIMAHIYKTENHPIIELDKVTLYVMLGGILGARFGHILFYDPIHYWNNPIEILPFKVNPTFQFTGLAGLARHGGILGALLALYLYTRKFKESYFALLDRLTIAAAALGGFIRLGNLMNSEIIGIPANVPWAFVFTRIDQIPRHPAQLYEAFFYFAISIVLYFVWKSGRFQRNNGFTFGLGISFIFIQRFLVESVKENQVPFEENLILNMGQTLSIPLVLIGILVMIWSLRSTKKLG